MQTKTYKDAFSDDVVLERNYEQWDRVNHHLKRYLLKEVVPTGVGAKAYAAQYLMVDRVENKVLVFSKGNTATGQGCRWDWWFKWELPVIESIEAMTDEEIVQIFKDFISK